MKRLLFVLLLVSAALCCMVMNGAAKNSRSAQAELGRSLNTYNSVVKELYTGYVDTLDGAALVNASLDELLEKIDPYTELFRPDDMDELTTLSSGQYAGIGALILQRGDSVVVELPRLGTPSHKGGMRPGDRILVIDGDTVGTPALKPADVSKRLRGAPGTTVRVLLRRPGFIPGARDSILEVLIERDNIRTATVPYYGVMSDGIGYIKLTTFNSESAGLVKDALREMMKQPLKGLILDLRGNGGGYLESAVQIMGCFVPKGTEIVRTRGRDSKEERVFKTTTTPLSTSLPIAVLTDPGTASSSEIVAGSMQDLDRGIIVGERSYGKGLVQNTVNLPYGNVLKLTRGRYYIPSGRLIQAIDYSHRNPDGTVARTPDSLTQVFHTRAGREVRDGGGITPDVRIEMPETNRLLYTIYADRWAFDFANRFQASHPTLPEDFMVDSLVFNEFKAFIDPARFHYDRQIEAGLDYLRQAARIEGYMTDSVQAQLDVLAGLLHHDLDHDLNFNRGNIINILNDEIGPRYFDESTIVRRSLDTDSVVLKARELLLDPERTTSILSGK